MMNSDWQWVQLGEISDVISKGTTPTTHGAAFLDSGIPFLRAEDVVGGAVDVNSVKYYIDEKTHNKLLSRSQLQPGDFLITIAGSLGRVGYVPLNAPPLNCNQAVAFVRLKPNTIDLNFLLYVFQYEGITKSLLDVQKVGTIGNLNLEQIRDFKIPLPPLPEQKRIASLLARADRLRTLRRTAHELGESLLQSVFLEMFGNPETNPKQWKKQPLTELTKYPITYGILKPGDYVSDGVIMLRIQDIKNGRIRKNGLHRVSNELSQQYRRTILAGNEIVMSLVGTLGLVALIDSSLKGANIHRNLGVIAPKANINTHFLYSYLSLPQTRELIMQVTKGGNQGLLNLEDLRNVQIPIPPLSLQEEFAGVVARVESLRGRMGEAGRQVEGLFEALLSEAFNG